MQETTLPQGSDLLSRKISLAGNLSDAHGEIGDHRPSTHFASGQAAEVANHSEEQLTEEERRWPTGFRRRFKDLLCVHGKNFAAIQKELSEHSASELVEYYYAFKQTDEYKRLMEDGNIPSTLPAEPTQFHKEICEVCQNDQSDNGQKCYCSSCNRAYHASCIQRDDEDTTGVWSCPTCLQVYTSNSQLEQARKVVQQEITYREMAKQRYDSLRDPDQKSKTLLASASATPANTNNGDTENNAQPIEQNHLLEAPVDVDAQASGDQESSGVEPAAMNEQQGDDYDDDEASNDPEEAPTVPMELGATPVSGPSSTASSAQRPDEIMFPPNPLKRRFTPPNIPWLVDETIVLIDLVKKYNENWDALQQDEKYLELFANKRKLRSLKLRWKFANRNRWVNKEGAYVGPTEYAASEKNVVAARKRQKELELQHYQSSVVPGTYMSTKATALPLHNLVVEALKDTSNRALLQRDIPMTPLPVLTTEPIGDLAAGPLMPMMTAAGSHQFQLGKSSSGANSNYNSSNLSSPVKMLTVSDRFTFASDANSVAASSAARARKLAPRVFMTEEESHLRFASAGTQTQIQCVKMDPGPKPIAPARPLLPSPSISAPMLAPAGGVRADPFLQQGITQAQLQAQQHLQRFHQAQANIHRLIKAQAALRQHTLPPPVPMSIPSLTAHAPNSLSQPLPFSDSQEHQI